MGGSLELNLLIHDFPPFFFQLESFFTKQTMTQKIIEVLIELTVL